MRAAPRRRGKCVANRPATAPLLCARCARREGGSSPSSAFVEARSALRRVKRCSAGSASSPWRVLRRVPAPDASRCPWRRAAAALRVLCCRIAAAERRALRGARVARGAWCGGVSLERCTLAPPRRCIRPSPRARAPIACAPARRLLDACAPRRARCCRLARRARADERARTFSPLRARKAAAARCRKRQSRRGRGARCARALPTRR